jgi:hypothetical protein
VSPAFFRRLLIIPFRTYFVEGASEGELAERRKRGERVERADPDLGERLREPAALS